MSHPYGRTRTKNKTHPSQPIPGREADMTPNNAGGVGFRVDCWTQLDRFLILGAVGGTYYVGEREHIAKSTDALREALKTDGFRFVNRLMEVSHEGRAHKNDHALFALALATAEGVDENVRSYAYQALPIVARIGTHLFMFMEFRAALGSKTGRGLKRALRDWYTTQFEAGKLDLQLVKYRQRNGWTHRDVLRIAHMPIPSDRRFAALLKFASKGAVADNLTDLELTDAGGLVRAAEDALKNPTQAPEAVADDIRAHRLPRETINTEYLKNARVWEELGRQMPMTALIRNLGKLTSLGLMEGEIQTRAVQMLGDDEILAKARIHPLSVLLAMRTYGAGHGMRGSLSWTPNQKVMDALDGAFYASFKTVEPTGKRTLLALDVSGSMSQGVAGLEFLNCREAACAMSMVSLAVEDTCDVVGFTSGSGRSAWRTAPALTELGLSARRRLDDNVRTVSGLPFGGTDCSLPMKWAMAEGREYDSFVVYTDNEHWAGDIHPSQALAQYRKTTGIPARLAAVAFAGGGFSIADPADAGMMDFVGFDAGAPAALANFLRGV